jgi:large subunit ribosomal protein L29
MIMSEKFKEKMKLGEKELNQRALELKQELSKERALAASGTKSEKPGKIRTLRREIARILTALNNKKKEVVE